GPRFFSPQRKVLLRPSVISAALHTTIDSYVANELCVVDMRMVRYETERKRSGTGISPYAGRTVNPGRQGQRRGNGNPWRFRVFGEAVASGCGERRHGSLESQTTSRPQAPSESE